VAVPAVARAGETVTLIASNPTERHTGVELLIGGAQVDSASTFPATLTYTFPSSGEFDLEWRALGSGEDLEWQVSCAPPNQAPSAAGDAYTTAEDTPSSVAAPGVLANDSDADGDALTARLVSGPAHGTLTVGASLTAVTVIDTVTVLESAVPSLAL
jgi:hypothetical protein